jgi:hypothetical protein
MASSFFGFYIYFIVDTVNIVLFDFNKAGRGWPPLIPAKENTYCIAPLSADFLFISLNSGLLPSGEKESLKNLFYL